jgi:hypothetical protein
VTTVLIVLSPTTRLIAPLAEPEVTAIPFTFTVALGSATVGVTVMALIEMALIEVATLLV